MMKKYHNLFSFHSITTLPIIAKGILRGDDAVKAVQAGCSGILVSNHGARQLDGVPSTVTIISTSMMVVLQFEFKSTKAFIYLVEYFRLRHYQKS